MHRAERLIAAFLGFTVIVCTTGPARPDDWANKQWRQQQYNKEWAEQQRRQQQENREWAEKQRLQQQYNNEEPQQQDDEE